MTILSDPWPTNDLEHALLCPVCASEERSLLYGDLADVTFFTSPGRWDLWQCATCASGWLDPRPTAESIHRAYGQYYTHGETEIAPLEGSGLRSRLGNGYRNWRYGSSLKPALSIGRFIMPIFPSVLNLNEHIYRYLPKRPANVNWAALDIGCGNGDFLASASQLGWRCYGVEPDPKARAIAQKKGFEVVPELGDIQSLRQKFEAITLSHVIEHVHDPSEVMMQVAALLVPGGHLYISTPNLSSVGHSIFGRHWRGLEIPRHLVLFNKSSLRGLLSRSGFDKITFHAEPGAFSFTEQQSRRIAAGADPYDDDVAVSGQPVSERQRRVAAGSGPRAEFLIVTARRALE